MTMRCDITMKSARNFVFFPRQSVPVKATLENEKKKKESKTDRDYDWETKDATKTSSWSSSWRCRTTTVYGESCSKLCYLLK